MHLLIPDLLQKKKKNFGKSNKNAEWQPVISPLPVHALKPTEVSSRGAMLSSCPRMMSFPPSTSPYKSAAVAGKCQQTDRRRTGGCQVAGGEKNIY